MTTSLMEMYLDEQEIPHERIAKSLHRATLDLKVTLSSVARRSRTRGSSPSRRDRRACSPSPLEVSAVQGFVPNKDGSEGEPVERAPDDSAPFSALAFFKVMADPFVGKLTYFRVYSGKLAAGSRVLNATNGRTERIGRLLMMHANHREIEECYAGDILAGGRPQALGTPRGA